MAEEEGETQAQTHPSIPPTPGQSSANTQAMNTSGLHDSPTSAPQMFPPVYSSVVAPVQNQEQNGHGQGLYAVQVSPFMGMMPEFSPSMLIPLTYKIPTRTTGAAGAEVEQGQGQGGEVIRERHGPPRQVVVRRFQVAIPLDLALLLKLAFAVLLFGQEGSRQRMIVLVLLASLVYLYQTGVLTPLIQYARRGLALPRPAAHPENAAVRQNDDNAGTEDQNQPAEVNQVPEPERANGINLWRIAREIQTFIVGFIASLLPGFEQHD